MDRIAIKKNVLDLAYKRNLQLINAILFIGGGSIIASLTGLILNLDKAFQYSVILFIVILFSYIFYNFIDNRLRRVSDQIKMLKK